MLRVQFGIRHVIFQLLLPGLMKLHLESLTTICFAFLCYALSADKPLYYALSADKPLYYALSADKPLVFKLCS